MKDSTPPADKGKWTTYILSVDQNHTTMDSRAMISSLGGPFLLLLGGALAGGAIIWSILDVPGPIEVAPPELIACFDEQQVMQIEMAPDMAAARFYFATGLEGKPGAIMGPVDAYRRHVPEGDSTRYRRFKALIGTRTDVEVLEEPAAKRMVKNSVYQGHGPWSTDFPRSVLDRMLQLGDCNGIGLAVVHMADGSLTFQLIPVKIARSRARTIGPYSNWIVSEPCPNFCADPPELYLHRQP